MFVKQVWIFHFQVQTHFLLVDGDSCVKRLFLPSNVPMAQATKHCLSLTTHRDTLAYAEDALLASRMNFNPGGKQACLWNGWFIRNSIKIVQPMIFPLDHPQFPNQPKGMKQVLIERELFHNKLKMKCKECTSNTCCARRLLECQPDFKSQRSLVQEIIEDAGHLCIFLPKFHCELNSIEFFWGAVKQ